MYGEVAKSGVAGGAVWGGGDGFLALHVPSVVEGEGCWGSSDDAAAFSAVVGFLVVIFISCVGGSVVFVEVGP